MKFLYYNINFIVNSANQIWSPISNKFYLLNRILIFLKKIIFLIIIYYILNNEVFKKNFFVK